jgi:hypothetical protein
MKFPSGRDSSKAAQVNGAFFSTEPLINRKPGSSKTYINQRFTSENSKRVIFRVIERKL